MNDATLPSAVAASAGFDPVLIRFLSRPNRPDGIYYDMPAPEYHALPRLSSGSMQKLIDSGKQMRKHWVSPKVDTRSRQFGSGVHLGVLEPYLIERGIAVIPDDAPARPGANILNAKNPSKESLEKIAFWRDFDASAKGKIVLTGDDFVRTMNCVGAVERSEIAQRYLHGGRPEVTILWTETVIDPETGEELLCPCKARIDYWRVDQEDLGAVDLKTCGLAEPGLYMALAIKAGYHIQAAHYMRGIVHASGREAEYFAHIGVEDEDPHEVDAFVFDESAISEGRAACRVAYERFARILSTGVFEGRPAGPHWIQISRFKAKFSLGAL